MVRNTTRKTLTLTLYAVPTDGREKMAQKQFPSNYYNNKWSSLIGQSKITCVHGAKILISNKHTQNRTLFYHSAKNITLITSQTHIQI